MTSIRLFSKFQLFAVLSIVLICYLLVYNPSHAELLTDDFILSIDTPEHNNIGADGIETIITSQQFTTLKVKGTSAKGSPWLKIQWDKSKITDEKFIINDFNSQAYEDYYLIKDNQVLTTYSSGYTKPVDEHLIKHFKFVADVSEADYLLVKTCCNPDVPIYFRLLNEKELNKQYYECLIWYAVIYSMITMMVLYNLFIYFYLREKQYLMYCYYLISILMVMLILSGIGKHFLWSNFSYTKEFYFVMSINASIASMLFQLAFLEKKYLSIFNKKLMYYTIGLHILIIFVYFLAPFIEDISRNLNFLIQLVAVLGMFITDYVVVRNIMAGDKTARILLFGFLLMNVASMIFIFRFSDFFNNIIWAERVVDIALLCEALVLSLALAKKIAVLREQKSQAEDKQLQAQRHFSKQLLQVQEEEKKQLGSALHDNFTHELLILKTNIIKRQDMQIQNSQHVDKILNEIRNLSHIVHPHLLERFGLTEALKDMLDKTAETYDIDINFASDDITLDNEQSIIVYRIIQESLNNIIKHANASECLVAIRKNSQNSQNIEVIIKDDGDGFKTETVKGLGIITIEKRCQMLSGKLIIDSNEYGTILKVLFPNSNL